MKNDIKKVLREGLLPESKNILNVKVSRPSQMLIIMRGVP
jgi:hypothetical protein